LMAPSLSLCYAAQNYQQTLPYRLDILFLHFSSHLSASLAREQIKIASKFSI